MRKVPVVLQDGKRYVCNAGVVGTYHAKTGVVLFDSCVFGRRDWHYESNGKLCGSFADSEDSLQILRPHYEAGERYMDGHGNVHTLCLNRDSTYPLRADSARTTYTADGEYIGGKSSENDLQDYAGSAGFPLRESGNVFKDAEMREIETTEVPRDTPEVVLAPLPNYESMVGQYGYATEGEGSHVVGHIVWYDPSDGTFAMDYAAPVDGAEMSSCGGRCTHGLWVPARVVIGGMKPCANRQLTEQQRDKLWEQWVSSTRYTMPELIAAQVLLNNA